jgi:hypothetical protein
MRPLLRLVRILLPFLLAVVVVGVIYFFVVRARPGAAYGAAVALCPGPDQYGYTCEGAEGYAYIDATSDTLLYLDDGVVSLELPFPFTFYGTVYSEVQASANGNLQFDSENPLFLHSCLSEGPAAEMGDMIAPYWTDLDLRTVGFLETTTVGVAPQRIFVVEWDGVPRFGDEPEETVTFEVQLFEGSNDIVFLYEDTTTPTGSNGSDAMAGLQSEAQGVALQYSCDQPMVGNGDSLRFPHPAEPNPELGMGTEAQGEREAGEQGIVDAPADSLVKEPVATLLDGVNREGSAVLAGLRGEWLSGRPQRAFEWQWLDLTGDGRDELVALWHGRPSRPELAEVAVLGSAAEGEPLRPLLHERLSTRQVPVHSIAIVEAADLTGDRRPDALLLEQDTGMLFVVAAPKSEEAGVGGVGVVGEVGESVAIYHVPETCRGSLTIRDTDGDQVAEIIRDGCDTPGRFHVVWDGESFTTR